MVFRIRRSLHDRLTRRDLKYDGCPEEFTAYSRVDGTTLQVYKWNRSDLNVEPKGILFLLHGVRAHLRLTWLAKRPSCMAHLPLPTDIVDELIQAREPALSEAYGLCRIDEGGGGDGVFSSSGRENNGGLSSNVEQTVAAGANHDGCHLEVRDDAPYVASETKQRIKPGGTPAVRPTDAIRSSLECAVAKTLAYNPTQISLGGWERGFGEEGRNGRTCRRSDDGGMFDVKPEGKEVQASGDSTVMHSISATSSSSMRCYRTVSGATSCHGSSREYEVSDTSPCSTIDTVGQTQPQSAPSPSRERLLGYSDATPEERETQLFYSGSWIEAFNMLGYDVFGMDLRGHGRSGGIRCSVDDFEHYCRDISDVVQQVIWKQYPVERKCATAAACSRRDTDEKINSQFSVANTQALALHSSTSGSGNGSSRTHLFVVGVSLSTLIVCRLLEQNYAKALGIHACVLISGFLKPGIEYQRAPMRALLMLLVKLRNVLPTLPIVIPKKPETSGPEWQMRYGDADPYLIRKPFTVKMLGTCISALEKFNECIGRLLTVRACKHLKVFHNYLDLVNPVDGSMDPVSWLMKNSKADEIDIKCTVFNGHHAKDEELKSWHPSINLDPTPLDLAHTLITDRDNFYVFREFVKYIESV